jgi:hypothetical protein
MLGGSDIRRLAVRGGDHRTAIAIAIAIAMCGSTTKTVGCKGW